MITFIMPRARAASVPGLIAMCQSACLGRARAHRVDDHDLGTLLLRLQDERPSVQVGADHVHAPHDDVLRVGQALDVQATGRAHGHQPGGGRSGFAIGLLGDAGAEPVEERVAGGQAVQRALMAQIGVRHDRLGAMGRDDPVPAALDLAQGLVPGDPLELAGALRADAAHRVQHPLGVVVVLREVLELHAQAAAGHRMGRIARDLDQLVAVDMVEEGAGVGAVVRAGAANDLEIAGDLHRTLSSGNGAGGAASPSATPRWL